MINLDIKQVQSEITALLLAYPELTDDEILREDMIEGSTSTFQFLSQIVRKIGATQAIAGGTADYIGELQERKARLERREHALRQLIFKVMQTGDLKKAELPEATLSIRNGQQKTMISDEQEIPGYREALAAFKQFSAYLRIEIKADRTKIKAGLLAGETINGAALSNSEPVLAIIVK